jgi:AmmeMemoRadiSam system protein B
MDVDVIEKEIARFPVAAGVFYPEGKTEILKRINGYNKITECNRARAIIAPHGAWDLTGFLACAAFSAAAGRKISRILLLGAVHDRREEGLFLSGSRYFYTPLGRLPVDLDCSLAMKSAGTMFEINDIPHLGEHSIEVLLPFVKYFFSDTPIVPVLMAKEKKQYIDDLANALEKVVAPVIDDTLIVISCNLSKSPDRSKAKSMADECLRLIAAKDWNNFYSSMASGKLSACGGGLVASLLKSGLVENNEPCLASGIVAAAGTDNDTVYYSSLYFK